MKWLARQPRAATGWPPLLVVVDASVTMPPRWARDLAGIANHVVSLTAVHDVKGLEYQNVVILVGTDRFVDLQAGFSGTGRRLYNEYRLLRIPFSRAKDSLAVFVLPNPKWPGRLRVGGRRSRDGEHQRFRRGLLAAVASCSPGSRQGFGPWNWWSPLSHRMKMPLRSTYVRTVVSLSPTRRASASNRRSSSTSSGSVHEVPAAMPATCHSRPAASPTGARSAAPRPCRQGRPKG